MDKEIKYLKHKLRLYEFKKDPTYEDNQDYESNVFKRIEDWIKTEGDKVSCYDGMRVIGKKFGPFGTEKIKILENSFDMFLENIVSGPGLKQEFYAVDKDFPKTFAENESFLKMKKYQQYESIPDEYLRDYVLNKKCCTSDRNEFNNEMKNKLVIAKTLKEEMKQGIEKLFNGKDQIYAALRRYDVLQQMHEGRSVEKCDALSIIKEMKQLAWGLTYKDVFGIQANDIEVEEVVKVPEPKVFKKMRVHSYGMDPKGYHPTEISEKYQVRQLSFVS